jgi:hypothetical protein
MQGRKTKFIVKVSHDFSVTNFQSRLSSLVQIFQFQWEFMVRTVMKNALQIVWFP